MICVPVPCKIGEEFTYLKFAGFIDKDNEKIKEFKEDGKATFLGVDVFNGIGTTWIHYFSNNVIHEAENFYTKYFLFFPDEHFENKKLNEHGFPSRRTGRLFGIRIGNGFLVADFVTEPISQHVKYYIKKDGLKYVSENEDVISSNLIYDERADKPDIVLSENDKKKILKKIIACAKSVGLKIGYSKIEKDKIEVDYFMNSIRYVYFMPIKDMKLIKRKINKKLCFVGKSENIKLLDNGILFSFSDLN